MNIKKFIEEEVKKTHLAHILKERKFQIEKELVLLEGESGYYPPGAEFDPRAPWNEEGPFEYKDYDVIKDTNDFYSFTIRLTDSGGGIATTSLYDMLEKTKASDELWDYFELALNTKPRPSDFHDKLENVAKEYFEFVEFDDYPDESDYI